MNTLARSLFAVALCCGLASATPTAQEPPPPSPAAMELAARLIGASEIERQEVLTKNTERLNLDLMRALNAQANRLMADRRFADALEGYRLQRQVAEQIGNRRGVAAALLGLGTIHGRQGDYEQAIRFLRAGLAIDEEIADDVNIEVALNNLGIVSRRQGEYEEALEYYGRALTLGEKLARPANVARTLTNVGIVHMLRGSYREALRFFQQSLRMKEATKQTADIPSTLANMGNVYERMGDPDLALEYYDRSLNGYEQLDNRAASAETLVDIGRLHADQRRYDLALDYLQRALSLLEASGSKAEMAAALQSVGNVHRARGDISGARSDFQRSLTIRESINDRPGTADVLVDVASALLLEHNASGALEAARRSVHLAGETGIRDTFWRARLVEGKSHEALGHMAAASEAYGEAVSIIEQLRSDAAGGAQERQRFLEGRLEPFQRLAGLLVAAGRTTEALGVAERAKARVMLDLLRGGRTDVRLLTLEERDRERQLEREMTAAHARLQAEAEKEAPDPRLLVTLRDAFNKARLADAEFRATLYEVHPTLRLSRGDAEPGSLQDIAGIVDDTRTALVEFMVAPNATYLFVASRDAGGGTQRLTCFTIPIAKDELSKETARFRRQLAERDLDFQQTALDLYRRLLGPARAELRGKTNIIIVPDGPLWELPFQALEPSPKHYWIEQAAISSAPSIAVLREMRARRTPAPAAPPSLVAFGDPSPPANPSDPAPAPTSAWNVRVPDAARQVRRLRQMYGARHSEVFVGDQAGEERFVSIAGNPTVLHVATHGVLDAASPMYSFLMLAGKPGDEPARDGRLEAWEIMKLKLHADVTVLAGCETARGRIGGGEGVIGLSWAFFLAGSPRTVLSLWKIDAASTTDLMLAFHRQLRAGLLGHASRPNAAASLRIAALSLLRDPRYRHPFYWAGFLVVGDGS